MFDENKRSYQIDKNKPTYMFQKEKYVIHEYEMKQKKIDKKSGNKLIRGQK